MLAELALQCAVMASSLRSRGEGVVINHHRLSRRDTRQQVEALAKHFDFIHHDDLLARIATARRRPFCLMTFDDGRRCNATETADELRKLGVPAVFFLITGNMNDRRPFWFDRYDALRRTLGADPKGLEGDVVKALPQMLREERLDRLCAKHGVEVQLDHESLPMSWDEARSLARDGFTIGSHTHRHPVLVHETEEDARFEIETSAVIIRKELGRPSDTFAFPNGNYTASLAHYAIQLGAKTVFTTEPVWASCRFPSWRLPRIQLHPGNSADRASLKLAIAFLGFMLQDPNGTGRTYFRIQRLSHSLR